VVIGKTTPLWTIPQQFRFALIRVRDAEGVVRLCGLPKTARHSASPRKGAVALLSVNVIRNLVDKGGQLLMFEKIVELKFSVNWLRWIIYAAFAMVILYVVFPTWHDPLVYIAAVLGGVGVLISAMNEIDARREEIAAEKARRALQYISDWNHPQYYYAKSKGRQVLKHFETNGHAEDQFVTDRLQNLIDVLNFFESLSLAIQLGHVDDNIAKRFFRGLVLDFWQTARPWIETRRAARHNPRLLKEIQTLAELWSN
jgi:hypothetical protein